MYMQSHACFTHPFLFSLDPLIFRNTPKGGSLEGKEREKILIIKIFYVSLYHLHRELEHIRQIYTKISFSSI